MKLPPRSPERATDESAKDWIKILEFIVRNPELRSAIEGRLSANDGRPIWDPRKPATGGNTTRPPADEAAAHTPLLNIRKLGDLAKAIGNTAKALRNSPSAPMKQRLAEACNFDGDAAMVKAFAEADFSAFKAACNARLPAGVSKQGPRTAADKSQDLNGRPPRFTVQFASKGCAFPGRDSPSALIVNSISLPGDQSFNGLDSFSVRLWISFNNDPDLSVSIGDRTYLIRTRHVCIHNVSDEFAMLGEDEIPRVRVPIADDAGPQRQSQQTINQVMEVQDDRKNGRIEIGGLNHSDVKDEVYLRQQREILIHASAREGKDSGTIVSTVNVLPLAIDQDLAVKASEARRRYLEATAPRDLNANAQTQPAVARASEAAAIEAIRKLQVEFVVLKLINKWLQQNPDYEWQGTVALRIGQHAEAPSDTSKS